jgi:aspartate/methionine/tyrosine aminotransferase
VRGEWSALGPRPSAFVFASRTQWNLAPNRLSVHLQARRAAGLPIIDLTESNPTRCHFDYDRDEILAALAQPRSLLYEPTAKGHVEARQAVAAYYAEKGIALDPEHIVLTASTSEAYSFLFRLLADPGDCVLIPRPSYPLFDFLATLNDVRLESYPLVYEQGWRIDFEALRTAVGPRTRALLVVNPNNPTGSFLHREDFATLTELCQQRGLAIISDEVFSDYTFRPDPSGIRSLAGTGGALTFVLNGLSKLVGLPQMKLAWLCASGPYAVLTDALARLEIIADTYLSVNTPVQVALPRLLAGRRRIQDQILGRVRTNRQALLDRLSPRSPCQCFDADGGWYAVLRVPGTRSEEDWILTLLDRDGVLIHPGYFFDFATEAYLVASLLPPPEIFREGIDRMLARIEAAGSL